MSFLNKSKTFVESTGDHSSDAPTSFEETFHLILKDISSILKEKPQSALKDWITSIVKYNVPHGKKIRGKLVETAFITLSGETDGKRVEQAQILGWCVEILQAAFLIADDLMDNGLTRRGLPCWYKVDNMGTIVANDAFILENLVYQIIKLHFGSSKLYANLVDIILGVTFNITLGQSLDTRYSTFGDKRENFDQPAMQLYHSIATLKTSYYTIYLPIALAIILADCGIYEDCNTKSLWKAFQDIALKIGTFFQIQDDYFDCFADEEKTGKKQSDIQEGKCSWLYAKASELSNPKQKQILLKNYGKKEPQNVSLVKELYVELDLSNEFLKIQQEMSDNVMSLIEKLDHLLLKNVLLDVFKRLFKRVC